ncbi:ABC transporter permease [Spiroplasma diminutum]|uniref:Efflux ABC transporter, permease protein n=1 Tax=Spiroplasma diminutum CUAS-1 TaxID=1276221 RepID=S5MJ83_9MOLU|nr:ABC transporter permease [Spiroplasma diminutum]AGR42025.1 efflux ABC transporter, permease protein [Spiroplasma diminutum CUAS-1]
MKKSLILYLKQGIKGVMKFKVQFLVIVILSFLATFILSISLSTSQRINNDYKNAMSKMQKFDYIGQKTVGSKISEESGTKLLSTMDLINNQFLYVKKTGEESSTLWNRAIDINHNLSYFENINGYEETFLTKTFQTKEFQENFINLLNKDFFWNSIFDYKYDQELNQQLWNPTLLNYSLDITSYNYLNNFNEKQAEMKKFYIDSIELLKKNFVNDLFQENTPQYLKNTLFYELKSKNIITQEDFNNEALLDDEDRNIYNRYLYFSIEPFIRQIINASIEYPKYWINKAINESKQKNLEDVIRTFNENKEKIGFEWMQESNADFGLVIFKWIFGFNPSIEQESIDENINNPFIVTIDNKPWKNNIDLGKDNDLNEYLDTKNSVFEKGMRGSLNQLVVRSENNKILGIDKTFDTNFLKHNFDGTTLEERIANGKGFWHTEDYKESYRCNKINDIIAFFVRSEIIAQATGFEYNIRGEIEFTDLATEISYRIVDIQNNWKKRITIYEGNMPRTKNEILINSQFARANKYKVGQNIKVGEGNFIISGIGVDPLTYYPMGNTRNPLPNNKKNVIIYINDDNLEKIFPEGSKFDQTSTKSLYSIYTNFENPINEINQNFKKLQALSLNNVVEVYNSYKYLNNIDSELKSTNYINSYSSFNSSNLKLNWTIAPTILNSFRAFAYIFTLLIFIITIIATVVAVKKTVELNAGEIGILKAIGVKNWQISSSYFSYGIVTGLFIVPIAWLAGAFIQEFISIIFLNFVSGKFNTIVINPFGLLLSVLIFGVLLCLISFFTAYFLVKKPVLEVINKVTRVKRIQWIDTFKNRIFKSRGFSTRFSIELAVSGFSKTILSSITIFFAAFFISFGLTIPGLVQNVVQSYYKNINYQNSMQNTELVGNAPLAKTSLSVTKEIEEYESNLFDSNNIFGNDILKISKDITNFAPSVDSSVIPQLLLSANQIESNDNKIDAKWVYDYITNINENEISNAENSLISIIGSLMGNNLKQLVGKGLSLSDIQKILEWVIHSNNFKTFEERKKKVDDLSSLLTKGLPEILTKFIQGSTTTEGNWKEQIISIILSQTPSYIKQYVTKSENRLNNFSFGWQINKYNPKTDSLYTDLSVGTKNNKSLNIIGLQSNQNAFKINKWETEDVFLTDYQASVMEKIINGEEIDDMSQDNSWLSKFYDEKNQKVIIPVIASDQTDFTLDNNWNNLTNPTLEKTRLILRQESIDIPNLAWMYDDGDWINFNGNKSTNNGYISMNDLSASKFTYAPIFEETGFNLIENKNNELKDNAYGFYKLNSSIENDEEKINLEIRPYYSYDNVTLFIPKTYINEFSKFKLNGNLEKWWLEDAEYVPEETKKAWGKINPSLESSPYFAIKPYSLYFDNSNSYEREEENLSGTPINNITTPYENFLGKTLIDDNGPITFGKVKVNWSKNIEFKKVSSIGVYGKPLIIIDQNFANILSKYDISKYIPFNLKYEDENSPSKTYTQNGVTVKTFDYINPLDYKTKYEYGNELIYGSDEQEKSIRPSLWYTGIYSNSQEPYFITTQGSFSRDVKLGQDILNGSNYGSTSLELNSTNLLGQQKTLVFQLSAMILSLATAAITLMTIIIILTITLINDLYVNQYKKFMIVMKSLGYSNWKIIKYTFGTMSIVSIMFYILGVVINFIVLGLIFSAISKRLGSIPFGLTWWTPILAIILVFGSFIISIAITTRKIRKEPAYSLMV